MEIQICLSFTPHHLYLTLEKDESQLCFKISISSTKDSSISTQFSIHIIQQQCYIRFENVYCQSCIKYHTKTLQNFIQSLAHLKCIMSKTE